MIQIFNIQVKMETCAILPIARLAVVYIILNLLNLSISPLAMDSLLW